MEGEFDGSVVFSLEDEGSFSSFLLAVELIKEFGCGSGGIAIGDGTKLVGVQRV